MSSPEDETKPSGRMDPRAEPPEQPKTTQLPAVPEWAVELTKSVKLGFSTVNVQLEELKGTDKTLTDAMTEMDAEFKDMRTRQRSAEEDIRRLSMRTKDTNVATSKADLEIEAKHAAVLIELAAEKAKTARLEATSATKDDLEKVAKAQTTDIVKSLTAAAEKSPTVRNLMLAVAGLAFLGISAMTQYLMRPPPPPPPTTVQVHT